MAGGEAGGTVPGGFSASVVREPFTAPSISESFSSLSLSSSLYEEPSSEGQRSGKNPWKIARRYQQDLCKKALEENIIVYLGTGCGKTHIAVLLLYEFGSFVRSPKKSVCVFLAPTVALVEQQARVIEDSLDLKVGVHCGTSKHLKSHCDWEKIIIEYEVLVMTPQILLRNLNHCFIRIQSVALLIFDECHHAQIRSNHPYAEIMKVFRKSGHSKLPHIFGMTASPVVGKGASCQENLPKCINSLENLLNAKVYTVDHKNELASFVASPKVKVYYYGPTVISRSCSYTIYSVKLEDIRRQCLSMLSKDTTIDHKSLKNKKKLLWRIHDNMIFSLRSLGLLGALQASHILRKSNHSERIELIEADGNSSGDSLLDKYASEAASMLASYCSQDSTISCISYEEALKEPFFSKKLLRLIGILSNFRVQPNMKCIIFVNRIITARCLSCILQTLKFLVTWKCDFLVGVHSGLKSMSRKMMNVILEKFRSGELNLLVATKVGEEGLDIQTCCLVIRFDLPETVASFIQSRGRARMPQSEYAFLVDSDNQKELGLIESFENNENRINREVSVRTSSEIFVEDEEKVYKVDISGATISSGYSISLLHEYCSKLPHDEYFDPKPEFFYCDDIGGTVCHIILPSNAAIHQVSSTPQSSVDAAKGDACLIACKNLHEVGVLNDFLLPQKNASVDDMEDFADSDGSESDGLRAELHEMLVPALLKERWNDLDVSVLLNSYFIKFTPSPEDRQYRNFGLFLKTFLPEEAVRMKIDLHLFHGRSVMTELLPSGVVEFGRDEVLQAQNFQEMFLKVILDRSEFVHEFVPLGKGGIDSRSSSTYYLLLPVTVHECDNTVSVDWEVIGRCLSSPTFANPVDSIKSGIYNLKNHLQLANGPRSIDDIVNGLVYVPHKRSFFFVSRVLTNTNAYSPHKQTNHVEHLCQKFGIRVLYPEQPLLEVKQLFSLHNLLHNRKQDCREAHELAEHFFELPPELCQLKIIGFSKDIGSSLSLLPSVMHHLENLLVAIELKQMLSASFQEGAAVTAYRILEALTTEKCMDRFSLERLEILGDAFLKFAVGRHLFLLHDSLDEGELTWRRSNAVNNSNLFKLATRKNLQVYIRDWPFDPCQFIALGRPCSVICCKETEKNIHSHSENNAVNISDVNEVRCSKNHHLLRKKTIADVVEALVGAFIVDSGFKAASAFLSWLGIQVGFESTQVANACIASSYYMRLAPYIDIDALENLLGYRFIHKGLLLQAFVHPSYNKHGGGCYQRLEFLGDAVMDYLITSYLYSVYPKLKPGQMTDLRSVSVNNKAFAYVAIHRSFHKYLISDSSSLSEAINSYADFIKSTASGTSPCEGPKCPKALGDLVESCIGAILLDTGFSLTYIWDIVLSFLDPIMTFSSLQLSPIRELLELCQSYGWNMQFPTSKRGDTFLVAASVTGSNICATASVSNINRKDAIRIASQQLYEKLKGLGYELKSKSLEEVLRSSPKMEAKLIGYNETPTDLVSAIAALDEKVCGLTLNEDEPNVDPDDKIMIRLLDREDCSSREDFQRQFCEGMEGGPSKVTARSALYEICAANYWNRPYFECCKEEGSDHLKLFTFKVVVEIDDENNVLECLGKPCPKKKDASEHAAEAMLWYLNHQGYLPKSK